MKESNKWASTECPLEVRSRRFCTQTQSYIAKKRIINPTLTFKVKRQELNTKVINDNQS